jgi:hypothetical protein
MMKKAIYLIGVLLTLFLACELGASTLQKSIIPEDADWVIHFDLEKFSSTRFGDQLLNNENIFGLTEKNASFHDKYQIDVLKDIKGFTVYGSGKDEENTVVCLRGNFDQAYLLGLLAKEGSHKETQHGNYIIHTWNYHEAGVFVEESLALIAHDVTAIRKALDVIAGKKANITSSSLMSLMNEIPPNAFFTALARDISELAEHESDVFIFKKTESALFTLTEEKEYVNLRLNFTVKTLEDAQNMESVIRGLISLAKMQMEVDQRDILRPLDDIGISTKGKKIRVDLTYPIQEMIDIVLGKVKFFPFHKLAGFDLHP